MPRKLLVGGMQRTGTLKPSTIKKVAPPVVPDLNNRHSGCSFSSGYGSTSTADRNSCCSVSTEDSFPPPPRSPITELVDNGRFPDNVASASVSSPSRHIGPFYHPVSQTHYTQVVVHPHPNSHPSTPTEGTNSIGFGNAPLTPYKKPLHGTQSSLEDQGIDVEQSPGRESPGASSGGSSGGGSRNSTSSLDSGRASAAGSDGKAGPHRMSVQIYETNSCQRQSYHSSSSSVDQINDNTLLVPKINVMEMMLHSIPDKDILQAWLTSLHFEDYFQLFVRAGYDMPTISRMTPEDLTAIGIKKPTHRRRLKTEIDRLNITDGLPEYKPDTLLEWLQLLRLEEYYKSLYRQGYNTVDKVTELTWEDLEEIGIQKLGHQKKIMLAIKRIKDINSGIRRPSQKRDFQLHGMDVGSGSISKLPHPTSLAQAVQPIPHYHYPSQEVAITTSRAQCSPTAENASIPELKTFQQSPPRNDDFFSSEARYEFSLPNQLAPLSPQNITMQTSSTNRGHSLESLDIDDSVSTVAYPHYIQSDTWYDTVSAWRQHGYDTDSELSAHAGESYNVYFSEGTPTLHRPKGMVKPRPIAKIVAKTRQEEMESNERTQYIEKDLKAVLKTTDRNVDGWTSLEGSPRHILPNRNSQSYGLLKLKRTPPAPPVRTKSMRCNSHEDLDFMQDKAFATCVQSLRSRFDQATNKQNELLPPATTNQERQPSPTPSEDFPPPPSPLPCVLDDSRTVPVTAGSFKPLVSQPHSSVKEFLKSDELSANPMFRQRRKDSADSNSSTSSTDSNSFPFANDNAGTIKQRISKLDSNHSTSQVNYAPMKKTKIASSSNLEGSINIQNTGSNGCDMNSRPGDVIDDIESMLASLSNQLDAMLDTETSG